MVVLGRDEILWPAGLADVRGGGCGNELQDCDKRDGGAVVRDDEDAEDLVEGDVEG